LIAVLANLTEETMKLNDAARRMVEAEPATLVTINRDGSAQSTLVWLAVRSTADGNDELVTGHLSESQKVRNIRRDPRISATFVSTDRSGPFVPYLTVRGTAHIEEGGAPELLAEVVSAKFGPDTGFPPAGAPAGYLTRISIEKIGGIGPWTD
jgi:PPOX class probable F420-dependent enzyme